VTPASAGNKFAVTPASAHTPHSAQGTPLIARSRSLGDATPARARPHSRPEPDTPDAAETGPGTPGWGGDSRELTDFRPFINCSAAKFVDFVLDPTVQPPRFAKAGEKSRSYTQALQRAPSVEMKAARHQQRRENGVLVRRRKVEREQAWIASKVEDITRRERAAAELLYQRQNKRLLARQRNVLTKVAIASRLQYWLSGVRTVRGEKEEYYAEHRAALAIGAWFRTQQMLKNMRRKNTRRAAAATVIQRFWRWSQLEVRLDKRRAAAQALVVAMTDMKGSGLFQEMIKTFRYKIVKIQRSWRELRLRVNAEVGLVVRKWERTRKYVIQKEEDLHHAIAAVKEQRSISQRERVAKRQELEAELDAMPKLGDKEKKVLAPQIMKTVAERWVRKHKEQHKALLRHYFAEYADYAEESAAMASKLAARQLMGAKLNGEGLPREPVKPFYNVLPSTEEVVKMQRAGTKLRREQGR